MEDFGIPVKEELVALDRVVVAQLQLLAVVGVCGQPADPGLGVPGGEPVGQLVRLQVDTGAPVGKGNALHSSLSGTKGFISNVCEEYKNRNT